MKCLPLKMKAHCSFRRSGITYPVTCHIQKDLKLCLHCCENVTYHNMSCLCVHHVSNLKYQNYMEKLMHAIYLFWERIRITWKNGKMSLLWHPGCLPMFWRNILLEDGGRIFFQNSGDHLSVISYTRWLQSCVVCVTHDMTYSNWCHQASMDIFWEEIIAVTLLPSLLFINVKYFIIKNVLKIKHGIWQQLCSLCER